jgi:hypothetical protein
MSCTGCQSSSLLCGCATDCAPYSVCPGHLKCPPPPPIPPCGCRTCLDGSVEQVWHPVHPLIPMLLECYADSMGLACGEEPDLNRIKCDFNLAHQFYSTCKYSGMDYYTVLCLHVAAIFEQRAAMKEWRSMRIGATSIGKSFNLAMPGLHDGIFGQMLAKMGKSRKTGIVLIGV